MAKEKSESELIGGEFYLIDEKKCLYASTKDDGIYYNAEGKGLFLRTNPRSVLQNLRVNKIISIQKESFEMAVYIVQL